MQDSIKTTYDTLTSHLHTSRTRTPEYYLQKWKRRQGQDNRKGGGRLEKFRRIARYKALSIDEILDGDIPKVFISEYHFYRWNVGVLRCVYCGVRLTRDNRTQDHVIPKAHGGVCLGQDNLEPACQDCNWAKGDSKLITFLFDSYTR